MAGKTRFANRMLVLLLAGCIVLLAVWAASPSPSQRALTNSAILAAGATAIALPLGTLLAVLIARFDLPGRQLAAAALGLLLFLPLYVQLSGWDAAFGKLGWITLLFGRIDEPLLAGMRGTVIVHGLAAVPWVSLIVGLGLSQVDPAQEEAALLVLSPLNVLLRVTIRQSLAFIAAAAIVAVVSTTSEMTVTNIFLINTSDQTLTEQFYMIFSLQAEASEAALGVLPGIVALGAMIAVTLWMVAQTTGQPRTASPRPPLGFAAGRMRPLLALILWGLILALLAAPLASLVTKAGFVVVHEGGQRAASWSLTKCIAETAQAPWHFRTEFKWTLLTTSGAATIALAMAVALGWWAQRGGWRALSAVLAAALTLAVPGPLVGVSLIWLFNRSLWPGRFDPLVFLYDDTPVVVMLAQAVHALPLATLIAWHSFRTLDRDVLAAAALDGLSPARVLWRIALPQRWRAVVAAWLAAFAIAAGDVAWGQLVRPAGLDLIQRRVFGLVHSGVEEQVAAISLVNIIAYAVLAGLILWLLGPRSPRRVHER
jgi:iron(III) transport system permease protein